MARAWAGGARAQWEVFQAEGTARATAWRAAIVKGRGRARGEERGGRQRQGGKDLTALLKSLEFFLRVVEATEGR